MSAPPQCCCLQCVLPNYPDSLTESTLPGNHMEDQGRVFLKNNLQRNTYQRTCDERLLTLSNTVLREPFTKR
ncbi:hypothetical protein DPMN_122641 [Dreissena polymorpha]|uniref:Uncharacterized protein n=1 Tax=Dreissena polymorpha TaxID=45954 RepID=A0A9D4GVX6_DREPO|nr:hypothetical protein DPMN_122641 [Dreissena polymorpha]